MSDLVIARNCCMARMLPGEAELVRGPTDWVLHYIKTTFIYINWLSSISCNEHLAVDSSGHI